LYASIISTISSQFTVHELPYVQMVDVKLHNMKHHAMQNTEVLTQVQQADVVLSVAGGVAEGGQARTLRLHTELL